ncbi:predicted protein [Plenodomus lingam JN3]|uniref:Predicted protein n=1 Tax=Leptosphaeria maculans (strain JN3 / isolate v23.1.3 / race Av1-4-5-6-7-8) TaxID=985895 RepID=E4ZMU6_LEPMJ|nr:predicted protein [Plenodomus lingam JN3]CBX92549.1 predicted protein [Plenodomus lingam JN3]
MLLLREAMDSKDTTREDRVWSLAIRCQRSISRGMRIMGIRNHSSHRVGMAGMIRVRRVEHMVRMTNFRRRVVGGRGVVVEVIRHGERSMHRLSPDGLLEVVEVMNSSSEWESPARATGS